MGPGRTGGPPVEQWPGHQPGAQQTLETRTHQEMQTHDLAPSSPTEQQAPSDRTHVPRKSEKR